MSGGTQTDRITHRCKKFAESYKKMASREDQEICGAVSKDLVKKTRHTVGSGTTSMFRGIYDDKQGQGVLTGK